MVLVVGHLEHNDEAHHEKHGDGKHAQRRAARKLSEHAYQQGAKHGSVFAEYIEEAVVLVGVFLGDKFAEFAARKRLNTALK